MNRIIPLSIFAISMAFFEASVVVYLRELYYPYGFNFPIQTMPDHIAWVEIVREVFSVIMLLSVGYLAGKRRIERFAWFIYAFAIWDIFYYVFLKMAIGWPTSLLTWDILFLIPTIWSGPVLAPVITSFSMILLTLVIVHLSGKDPEFSIGNNIWTIIIGGAFIVFISYIWDYCRFVLSAYNLSELIHSPLKVIFEELSLQYIPEKFTWPLFIAGELIIITGICILYKGNSCNGEHQLHKRTEPVQ